MRIPVGLEKAQDRKGEETQYGLKVGLHLQGTVPHNCAWNWRWAVPVPATTTSHLGDQHQLSICLVQEHIPFVLHPRFKLAIDLLYRERVAQRNRSLQ